MTVDGERVARLLPVARPERPTKFTEVAEAYKRLTTEQRERWLAEIREWGA